MPCHDSTTESISCKQGCHVGVCKLQSAREAKKKSRQILDVSTTKSISCEQGCHVGVWSKLELVVIQFNNFNLILCNTVQTVQYCANTVQYCAIIQYDKVQIQCRQCMWVGGWVWHFLYRRGAACPSCPQYGLHTIPQYGSYSQYEPQYGLHTISYHTNAMPVLSSNAMFPMYLQLYAAIYDIMIYRDPVLVYREDELQL